MGILSELHARPPEDWLPRPLYAERDPNELYHQNSHYKPSSYYGGIISVLRSVLSPDGPHGYTVQAQHILREPVAIGSHLVFDQSAQGPPAVELEPTMDDVHIITAETPEDDAKQDERGVLYGPRKAPMATWCNPSVWPMACASRILLLTNAMEKADLFRFRRYAERLRSIHRAGLDVGNVIMMFIAGGRVYTGGLTNGRLTSLRCVKLKRGLTYACISGGSSLVSDSYATYPGFLQRSRRE
ncbi:unnamed protein product [Rhizoctonia solani]|uniref:Uncharacterized protein n=1 Tax=Rhizoctonia solani TaxID=456999 RepID=A0A8H3HT12_9AGAM|nr:unnamed protein product [Rhizoctonia solani]